VLRFGYVQAGKIVATLRLFVVVVKFGVPRDLPFPILQPKRARYHLQCDTWQFCQGVKIFLEAPFAINKTRALISLDRAPHQSDSRLTTLNWLE
jgi:hypothetical protein